MSNGLNFIFLKTFLNLAPTPWSFLNFFEEPFVDKLITFYYKLCSFKKSLAFEAILTHICLQEEITV